MEAEIILDKSKSKEERYQTILPKLTALIKDEPDLIANMANMAAVLKMSFDFFWVGFYLVKNNALVLGPFQGPIACTRIPLGKGVCGTQLGAKKCPSSFQMWGYFRVTLLAVVIQNQKL